MTPETTKARISAPARRMVDFIDAPPVRSRFGKGASIRGEIGSCIAVFDISGYLIRVNGRFAVIIGWLVPFGTDAHLAGPLTWAGKRR